MEQLTDVMIPQALLFRTMNMELTPTVAAISLEGRVDFAGFSQADIHLRKDIIRDIVSTFSADAYLFLADGRVTDTGQGSCEVCKGVGCDRCRFTGRLVTHQCDAIHVIRVTRGGSVADRVTVEYEILDGKAVETKRTQNALDPLQDLEYRHMWSAVPKLTVH